MSISFAEMRSWHRPLMIMVAAMGALVVVGVVGLVVDGRELMQQSIWAKPVKFGVSFVIYGTTLAWMLAQLRRARHTMWTLGTAFAVTGLIDVGFVVVQAVRGTYSHFNKSTDVVNQIGQQVFSWGVLALFAVSMVLAGMMLFQRVGEKALTWALRAGIALAFSGMTVALFIVESSAIGPRTVQDAYGNPVPLVGQHGVGAPDGGGIPITNWSTVGGDLRVPHFIGLHAVQVLVLTVLALTALAARVSWLRSERVRAQLTGVVILGYTALFAITTWQAVRGQSLVHPDAATWTALAATVAVTALLAWLTIAAARRTSLDVAREPSRG